MLIPYLKVIATNHEGQGDITWALLISMYDQYSLRSTKFSQFTYLGTITFTNEVVALITFHY